MIKLRSIEKSFPTGATRTFILRRIDIDVKEGEFISIMGPSGAGKSTLLHIIGMHDIYAASRGLLTSKVVLVVQQVLLSQSNTLSEEKWR